MKSKFTLFLFAAVMLLVSACAGKEMTAEDAQQWIEAYTPEFISSDSRIRIEPTEELMGMLDADSSLESVFSFSPNVKGKAGFVNGFNAIDFYPEKRQLKEGKEYECRVDMARLTGQSEMNDFVFKFRVVKREVKFDEVSQRSGAYYDGTADISGRLVFNHSLDGVPEDSYKLVCSEPQAEVSVKRTYNDKALRFVVSNVPRKTDDYKVTLKFTAGSAKTSCVVDVAGLEEFKLVSAENNRSSQPYVSLEFSTRLDPVQELDGLITVEGVADNLKIERDGATVRVYYQDAGTRNFTLCISELVRSSDGRKLGTSVRKEIVMDMIPPAIEVPISGTILPDGNNLVLPFKAVNLAAVDVEVVKIYSSNVLRFLQDNELYETDGGLRRVGRLIYKKTVRLDGNPSLDLHRWQNFSVNLEGLFKQEKGAIYNVRLAFRKAYSLYDRSVPEEFEMVGGLSENDVRTWDQPYPYVSRYAPDMDWSEYSWRESDDPSKDSYYMVSGRMPEYNLLASNLGLIVKKADDKRIWTTVSDIMTTAPLQGIKVTAYNYQLQEVGSGWTDSKGFADFNITSKPYIVTASNGQSISYLKVNEGSEKSTSLFDVSGKTNQKGIKGYTYGERGIWRPGDDIYLTLILEDKQRTLPANHPVTMDLTTPDGILYDRQTLTKGVDGFYTFCTKTADDAVTGRWNAKFTVGGSVFNHAVRIETIKPNRLKINVGLPEYVSADNDLNVDISAAWLTGVTASNLRTTLEMTLYSNDKPFNTYSKYCFANPLMDFSPSTQELGSGVLDSLGNVSLNVHMPKDENAPGMLQANFVCRVAESGGDESVTSKSVRYSPFSSYVGIDLGVKDYETDKDLKFPVVTVDPSGNSVSGHRLEWKIYKIQWRWWWEGSSEDLSRYVQGKSSEIVANGELFTKDGQAEIPFRVDYPSWGRYLVFVRDAESGHATGGVVTVDWPSWRGRADRSDAQGASILSFSMDKNKYEVGETASVFLPGSAGGRVLLSFENGTRVISRQWVSLSSSDETVYKFKVTKDLAPNFYVHATLLQPHRQTVNDLPVRMYGIQGAEVVDKNSILNPVIDVAESVLPQKEFTVKVKEQNGKPMTYTLAIVDEGLLDINGFKTPNAWRTMNLREALGVRTWDLYDDVIGAYAGKFTSVLSIGGDEALRASAGKEKRFNPVVKFIGPFTTDGGTKTHRITLPMYVGSVRVMVVAAHQGAYGSAEKNVAVRSPLMLLTTLPRQLSCGDKVNMPVNLFAMEDGVKDVEVAVEVEGPVKVKGSSNKTVTFSGSGEKIVEYALSCDPEQSGTAKITITAKSGKHTATETVNIQVRNPHAPVVTTEHVLLSNGEREFRWSKDKCAKVSLEMSTLPSVNFSKLYSFVKNYSHYCTEQLSSRAMYLLYARRFLDPIQRDGAELMIRDILRVIASRQLPDGGFGYWDAATYSHPWATSMVGEVMTEAINQGFSVSSDSYEKWLDFQTSQARKYAHKTVNAADLQQAYRLYTLALAGKEQTAAMNRLKESESITEQAKYRLAAAYHVAGKDAVALSVFEMDAVKTKGDHNTFWSQLRDDAMKLETLILLGKMDVAIPLARDVAERFMAVECSTQEVAFVSAAFARLQEVLGGETAKVHVSYRGNSTDCNVSGVKSMDIPVSATSVTVRNESEQGVYLSLFVEHQPSAEEIVPAMANGASISVTYTDLNGKPVDITNLKQGTEVYAEFVARKKDNMDSNSMALTFVVPSGWEIWNERIHNEGNVQGKLDIRDDRVCWYFRLNSIEKKSLKVRLRAAYEGEFIMPATVLEDMYRADCRVSTASSRVEVTK